MMKRSGNLRKAQELIITGMTSSTPDSKWKPEIPFADKNCEGSLGAAPWKLGCR